MINKEKLVNSLENLWGFRKKIIQFKFNSKDLLRNANKNLSIGIILGTLIYGLGFLFQNIYPGNYIFTGYLNFFYICYICYILLDYFSNINLVKHLNYINDWMDDILINKSEVMSLFKKHLESEKVSESERVAVLLKLQNLLSNYEKETEQFQIEKIDILKIYSKLLAKELSIEIQELKASQELKNHQELESILGNIDKNKIKSRYLLEGNSREEYSFFKNEATQYFSKEEKNILKNEDIFDLVNLFEPEQYIVLIISVALPAAVIYQGGTSVYISLFILMSLCMNLYMFKENTIKKYLIRRKVNSFIDRNFKTKEDIISFMVSAENVFTEKSDLEKTKQVCKNYLAYKAGFLDSSRENEVNMDLIRCYIKYVEKNENNNEMLINKSRLNNEILSLIDEKKLTLNATR